MRAWNINWSGFAFLFRNYRSFIFLLCFSFGAMAQVPDAPGPAPAPASGPAPAPAATGEPAKKDASFLGKDIPMFDPGSEIVTWDGKNWNINNNRLFQSRFEKYLNAPEENTDTDKKYRDILKNILDALAPIKVSPKTIDEAFRLLPKASNYEIDARLCDALADAVYSAWQSLNAQQRLAMANDALEQERKAHEWNLGMAASSTHLEAPPPGGGKDKSGKIAEWQKEQTLKRDTKTAPYATRLAEVLAQIKANQMKKELSQLQTKIEFQALIAQFFFQRRFQHVLIATRFYRAVFSDGDTKLQVGKDTKDLFEKSTGLPPTVGTLDSMANEAARDVREGVSAYDFLLEKNEMESATKRLAEAFSIGEYMPEIRTLSRDKKRRALEFTQKTNQLVSAIDVKDYELADKLVKDLQVIAKDFDTSKPTAAIQTAKAVSAMRLQKAKNAAVSGDRATLETELAAATEIWPRNPALKEFSEQIFSQADVQQKALIDLDQLISQHNYRQIYNDKERFMAAAVLYPDRQEQLRKILEDMGKIEITISQASEIAKRGDYAGAWETAEKVFKQFPEDSKLNQVRANLTTEAADFVLALRTAEQLEQKDQTGSSLAYYLKARKIYPASDFAQEGIKRLVKKIMPEE